MSETAPVTIALRIPGKWAHPKELIQALPKGCRLTAETLTLPDATKVDFGAVDGFTGRRSDAKAWKNHQREQRVLGGNIQIIGSPEHVVDDLLRLKAAGIDGVQLTFFDFEPDLKYFGEAVLPLMEQAGLRVRVQSAA